MYGDNTLKKVLGGTENRNSRDRRSSREQRNSREKRKSGKGRKEKEGRRGGNNQGRIRGTSEETKEEKSIRRE